LRFGLAGGGFADAGLADEAEVAFGKIEDEWVVLALVFVIFGEFLAEAADLDPNGGVEARIVVGGLSKRIDTDGVFLEWVCTGIDGVVSEIFQETPGRGRVAEGRALKYPIGEAIRHITAPDHLAAMIPPLHTTSVLMGFGVLPGC
jgi:hypothetical protein